MTITGWIICVVVWFACAFWIGGIIGSHWNQSDMEHEAVRAGYAEKLDLPYWKVTWLSEREIANNYRRKMRKRKR